MIHKVNCPVRQYPVVLYYEPPCTCNEPTIEERKIIRVFPTKTSHTPDDELVFFGPPPFEFLIPEANEVHVSVTFTWDREEGEKLFGMWQDIFPGRTKLGGPAFNSPNDDFVPGMYLKQGVTRSTKGCFRKCDFCMVPEREGKFKLLNKFYPGHIVQDNNLIGAPMKHLIKVFEMLEKQSRVTFSGGIDVRIMTQEKADLFKKLKIETIFMAYDQEEQYEYLVKACEMLKPLKPARLSAYVLVGYEDDTPEAAEQRLRKAFMAGCYPYMMFYRDDHGFSKAAIDPAYNELKGHWNNRAATHMHMKKIMEGDRTKKNQIALFDLEEKDHGEIIP
jgi:hypothetical protein